MASDKLKPKTTVRDVIQNMLPEFKAAMPRHLDPERMARIFLTEIRKTPKLLECSPESLMGALMQCAQVGLEPGGVLGFAYLVPYKNNKTGRYECQFQFGYKGLVHLVRRSGELSTITAQVVYEKDYFVFEYGSNERIEHRPHLGADRGKAICAYSCARLKDGSLQFTVMPIDEINKVKASAKAATSGPWKTWEPEMQKKTVIKRLSKLLPLDTEIQSFVAQDETTKFYNKELNILEAPDQTDWDKTEALPDAKIEKKKEKKLTKRASFLLEEMEKHYENDTVMLSVLNTVTRTPDSPEDDGVNSFFDLDDRMSEIAFFRWKALVLFQKITEATGSQEAALKYLTEATSNPKKEYAGVETIAQVNNNALYGILKTRFLSDQKEGLFEDAKEGEDQSV